VKLRLRKLIFTIASLGCLHNGSGCIVGAAVVEGTQQQTKVQFLPTGSVDGVTEDGWRFSSEAFESNGTGVTVTRIYCANKAAARRALAQKLKTSTVIVESAILWSNKRQALGKRVIARFGDKNSDHNTILWTERNTLFIIDSSSFRHSLLLEKSFFRK
jgi:hypothetical protein